MKRLLAIFLLLAVSSADASRFRAPVFRTPVSRVPLLVSAPTLDLAAASELSPLHLDLIQTHSARGIENASEFLQHEPLERGGYLLGISGNGRHNEFAEATGLTPFVETYIEIFGRPRTVRTPEFLDFLTRSGEEVVFLIPPKALTHEKANISKEELEWLFDNRERMKSVRFVFGAYDLPEVIRNFPISDDSHRVEQRKHHSRDQNPFEEVAPELLVAEFEAEIIDAPMVRERSSRRMFYFQTEKGIYIVRRILRGYFLEAFPAGGSRRREAFISKRDAPKLFARIEELPF
ncbi:MAG: hypothetical protein COB53_10645 [Elusimicrobia bacterium]|nr:MAG: hypothetical protein COB53_10645 [Elusimicrobiota bacterium]